MASTGQHYYFFFVCKTSFYNTSTSKCEVLGKSFILNGQSYFPIFKVVGPTCTCQTDYTRICMS